MVYCIVNSISAFSFTTFDWSQIPKHHYILTVPLQIVIERFYQNLICRLSIEKEKTEFECRYVQHEAAG